MSELPPRRPTPLVAGEALDLGRELFDGDAHHPVRRSAACAVCSEGDRSSCCAASMSWHGWLGPLRELQAEGFNLTPPVEIEHRKAQAKWVAKYVNP